MGNNVLQSLLFITLNGPDSDTPDLAELIGKTQYEGMSQQSGITRSHQNQVLNPAPFKLFL